MIVPFFIISLMINIVLIIYCFVLVQRCKKYEAIIKHRDRFWYNMYDELPTNGRQTADKSFDESEIYK